MKTILGLDLGTNSIGWALVEIDHERGIVKIIGLGSRIIPMDAGEIKDFESSGKIKSSAALRTEQRGARRSNERFLLRRDRLHLVLNLLEALPEHYKIEIDFTNKKEEKCGQFKKNKEPKLAFLPKKQGRKAEFLFMETYNEMLADINDNSISNKKGKRIPYDWTLYYLRQKALSTKISLEELAWVLLSYNQKRGYEKTEVEDKSTKANEFVEELDLRVKSVIPKIDNKGQKFFEIQLDGNDDFVYKEFSDQQMTFENDIKEIVKISKLDEQGNIDKLKTEYKVINIYQLIIQNVVYEKVEGKHKYTLSYHNGWIDEKPPVANYTFKYKNALNKPFDYIVETVYDNKGNIKKQQGKERKFREPDFSDKSNDWTLLKKKTEKEALTFNIDNGYKNKDGSAKNYISPKIYNVLKNDATSGNRTKIIGGMFQTVDRSFYREELKQIISTQKQFHTTLQDKEIFEQCIKTLYPKNKNHQDALLKNKDAIQHLLVEDIILYQRPLKSKKSEISNCKYEIRYWKDAFDKKGKLIEEINKDTGEIKTKKEPIYIKAVPTSHPYFQEFRIWDKLHNLRLIQLEKEVDGKILTNQDVTKEFFKSKEEYEALFEELNNRKSLNQEQFLSFCKRKLNLNYKAKDSNFVWNFPEDEELKGNETRVSFATRFKRCGFTEYADFLTQEKEVDLWHYLYSVNYQERTAIDQETGVENKSATTFFNNFFKGFKIEEEVKRKIVTDFVNYPKFTSRYCAYSEKALKKLIPLIRLNSFAKGDKWEKEQWYINWKESLEARKDEILRKLKKIDFNADEVNYSNVIKTEVEIQKGEIPFPKGLFNAFKDIKQKEDFVQLNLTEASYLVYGRHSELAQARYWKSPDDIRKQLHQELKQHSLNNPVAEKVILEMMQIVADIWEYYGDGKERYFSRIHLEVGRELKKSAKEKEAETKRMSGNRTQNKRLRQILEEFLANSQYQANPRNADHFERLKIVEDGAEHRNNIDKKFFDENEGLKPKGITKKDIDEILKKQKISKEDFEKYKLWIEQGYKSPYTNKMIKLTDLFNGSKYNIDHIFPQALVTNNSLNNKVVCETEINKLKSNQTGRTFINNPKERRVFCEAHKSEKNPTGEIEIINDELYVSIVKTQFSGTKKYILLSKEVPKGFTNSQMNNARHIARKAMELLSHIVREPGEVEFRSKNVLPVTGLITAELKRAWKLDQVWSALVAPRYIRLNQLTQSNLFGEWQTSKSGHKYFDCNLDENIRNKDEAYDIKRIDHRHHALDALIVALCTEEHVNYINNINANVKSDNYGKQKQIEKYRQTIKRKIKFTKKDEVTEENNWYYMLPGEIRLPDTDNSSRDSVMQMSYFYKDSEPFDRDYKKMILSALQHTIVTFKQNLRVINNRVNYYQAAPNTKKRKAQEPKTFKDIENSTNKYNWGVRRSLGKATYYAKKEINGVDKIAIRESLNNSFSSSKILTIADTQGHTKNILLNHLKRFDTVELPFEEAIEHMDALLEKDEFLAIVENAENKFSTLDDFIRFLRENNFKHNKSDYKKLNVFIEKVPNQNFREEDKDTVVEHPEIAFTPEEIEKMNIPDELRKLNNGNAHKSIRKVKITRGFGKQRPLNEEDENSVKFRQYVVSDSGSNLYLGFYERSYFDDNGKKISERRFKDIGLMELIETLKQDISKRQNPLPNKIYDDQLNEYDLKFVLSPLNLVYVPTDDEIENPSKVDFKNLSKEQIERIYKYTDGNEDIANFIPYAAAKPIWRFHGEKNKEIHKELSDADKIRISRKDLIQNEFGLGSQQNKNQNMIDGKTQIKKTAWKIEIDRLGNIKKLEND